MQNIHGLPEWIGVQDMVAATEMRIWLGRLWAQGRA
jgi:hypothetical protein